MNAPSTSKSVEWALEEFVLLLDYRYVRKNRVAVFLSPVAPKFS